MRINGTQGWDWMLVRRGKGSSKWGSVTWLMLLFDYSFSLRNYPFFTFFTKLGRKFLGF